MIGHRVIKTRTTSSSKGSLWLFRFGLVLLATLCSMTPAALSQTPPNVWRSATEAELHALLPARAAVGKEHIETEGRSASGVTNGHGKFVAGIVLITAGYSADGKYSHYLIAQVPIQIGEVSLPAGEYVFGWQRGDDQLSVHFYDAATGNPRGSIEATRIANTSRVESFKIWPPSTKSLIQVGRFGMPYRIQK
ncbi:hypothetical protein BH10ACI4_BH10ACI4_20780 [soil metagenome]